MKWEALTLYWRNPNAKQRIVEPHISSDRHLELGIHPAYYIGLICSKYNLSLKSLKGYIYIPFALTQELIGLLRIK